MEETGRLIVVTVAIVCVLIGSVGWTALGWAWAIRRVQPSREIDRIVKAGGTLALACGIGLVFLSWTTLLHVGEALLGVAVWATSYVATIGATESLDK